MSRYIILLLGFMIFAPSWAAATGGDSGSEIEIISKAQRNKAIEAYQAGVKSALSASSSAMSVSAAKSDPAQANAVAYSMKLTQGILKLNASN